MTEPTNEQIERAAKDAGFSMWVVNFIKANAVIECGGGWLSACCRSILAHARTIAEAEAREARLIEQIRLNRDTFRDCDIIDDPIGAAAQLEVAMHCCNAILQENPDG